MARCERPLERPTNAVEELQARVNAGDLTALHDPLLLLAMLTDPGWWEGAAMGCELEILCWTAIAIPRAQRVAVYDRWRLAVAPTEPAPVGWSVRLARVAADKGDGFKDAMDVVVQGWPKARAKQARFCLLHRLSEALSDRHRTRLADLLEALPVLETWSV